MSHGKAILISAVIAIAAMAVVFRVSALKTLVTGAA
jgi:hypothetical protein